MTDELSSNKSTDTKSASPYDVSMKNTPKAWLDAERDSPADATVAKTKYKANHTGGPITHHSDPTNLILYGGVAAALAVAGWIAAEMLGLFESPFLTIPAGILIAFVIRGGTGPKNTQGRATASVLSYVVTLMVVLALLTRREVHEIYGNGNDVALLEDNLLRRRFQGLDQIAAYAIGAVVTWYTSIQLRRR